MPSAIVGGAISAGSNILGGLLGSSAASKAAAAQQAEEERRRLAEQEAAREREFALRNGPVTCRYNQYARWLAAIIFFCNLH